MQAEHKIFDFTVLRDFDGWPPVSVDAESESLATTAVRLALTTSPLEKPIRFRERERGLWFTSCHVLIGFMCPYDIQFQPPVVGVI